MDTMNIRGSTGPDDLAELRNHKKIVGMKQLKKALLRGGVARVYLALDADPAVTMPLAELAQANGTPIYWVGKMHDLGRACSIDVDLLRFFECQSHRVVSASPRVVKRSLIRT